MRYHVESIKDSQAQTTYTVMAIIAGLTDMRLAVGGRFPTDLLCVWEKSQLG
jgi:hypothetical protein